jgi:integrase/recombinase XerD
LRIPEDTKEPLTPTQIQAILAQPDPSTRQGRRDQALLLLLVDTGARVSETLALKQEDIDLVNLQITLRGTNTKTRRTRVLPISKRTANAIRAIINDTDSDYMFMTRTGKQLSYKRWVALRHMYAKKAGITATVTPHILRHSFARNWIVAGGDPFSLQRMLGHSDMNMVRRYVQLYSQDVKEKHAKYSLIQ